MVSADLESWADLHARIADPDCYLGLQAREVFASWVRSFTQLKKARSSISTRRPALRITVPNPFFSALNTSHRIPATVGQGWNSGHLVRGMILVDCPEALHRSIVAFLVLVSVDHDWSMMRIGGESNSENTMGSSNGVCTRNRGSNREVSWVSVQVFDLDSGP